MRRKRVNKNKDKKIFTQTARKTKRINIAPHIMRGGIRF